MSPLTDRVPLPSESPASSPERRSFLFRFFTGLFGAMLGAVTALPGLAVMFDPVLRRKSSHAEFDFLRITSLDAVPDDGVPRLFPVVADRDDAWTFSPNERVGAVYLKRMPGETETVQAFNAICPHAGCFVGFDQEASIFKCPCHTSSFTKDGQIIVPSPSPRGMDRLEAKVEDGSVLVAFANFIAGREEKTPRI